MQVVIRAGVNAVEAAARLDGALGEAASVEVHPDAASDRRLTGAISAERVNLSIKDANIITRRKSWNVEFHGVFTPTADGATLHGVVDIPDRGDLHRIVWLFRVAAGMALLVAIGIAAQNFVQGTPASAWPVAFAGVIAVAFVAGTALLEREGERAAAEDAELLVQFLKRYLA